MILFKFPTFSFDEYFGNIWNLLSFRLNLIFIRKDILYEECIYIKHFSSMSSIKDEKVETFDYFYSKLLHLEAILNHSNERMGFKKTGVRLSYPRSFLANGILVCLQVTRFL